MFCKNLLIYINASFEKDEEEVIINQINNYMYSSNDFLKKISQRQKNIEDDLEIFCILGTKEDIENINNEIHNKINYFTHKFIDTGSLNTRLKNGKNMLQKFYYLYINNLLKKDSFKFPKTCQIEMLENIYGLALYVTDDPKIDIENKVNSVLKVLFNNEKPHFEGKQIVMQSFLLRDVKDRKILSILPAADQSGWYALLEGGIKLHLSDFYPYRREKISSEEIGFLTSLERNSMISNPCYSFQKFFVPYELFEEWNNVFLYALAVLPINYKIDDLKLIYTDFLKFIENNVCNTLTLDETIIPKDTFFQTLSVQINFIRDYTKGLEELGISKNILMLLKNKNAYLPVVFDLIKKYYPLEIKEKNKSEKFSRDKWLDLIAKIKSNGSNFEKGLVLEDATAYFINCIKGLKITGKRVRLENEEIDLVCCNVSENYKLWELGAVILIECKNWKEKVDTKVIRNITYIMNKKGITTTLLFTKNNITKGAQIEIHKQAAHNKFIIVFDLNDLCSLTNKNNPYNMLLTKYDELLYITEENLMNMIM